MVKIFWTPEAVETFNQEIDYIFHTWGKRATLWFIERVENCIELLQNGLILARYSKNINAHFFVISKQTSLIYRSYPNKNQIDLLQFWNNYSNPDKLKDILNGSD